MTDKQYGVMKEFTGGAKIIADDDDDIYKKFMKICDGGYIQPNMALSEVKSCFFNYVVMVKMKRTPIDKNSQYKFFSTIDISDIKQIITDINECPMLLVSMLSTSTYYFAQAFIIKHYMKYLLKKMI